jgi:hypothetical protein
MSCQIRNNANIDLTDLEPHIHGMYDHFHQKIGFQKPPVIVFDSDPSNESNVLGKTAYYDPQSFEVHVFTDARHPKDMLRSIAHELIHHGQNLEGRLDVGGYNGPGYYLKNDKLKDLEEEAMTNSAIYLREYEDGLKLKEKNEMSLKEWKNNELNQLLLKKFGILKEQKQEVEEITQKQEDNLPPEVVDAIKKKEGEEGKEEVEESVRADRAENEDNADGQHSTASGKSDRFKNLGENKEDQEEEVLEEEEDLDEGSCGSKRYMKEEELDEMSGNANQASDRTQTGEYPNGREQGRLRESIRKTLKENRAIRLKIKR